MERRYCWRFAEVTLELRERDGTRVGSYLVAGRKYEVHYQTDSSNLNDYALDDIMARGAGIGMAAGGIRDAGGPTAGHRATTDYFVFQKLSANLVELADVPAHRRGYVVARCVWAAFAPVWTVEVGTATDAISGGDQGHLCNIVPATTGEMFPSLSKGWFGDEIQDLVTMEALGTFEVE